ncbi:MAG: T9SS type A sorting domain-containing protein, partial [Bacteroidetes bacterium]|nr:T9SS type A sorting domain-containing protein [Bacteroidota bacterium]
VVVTVEAHSTTDGLNTGPSAAVSATATWDAERVSVENEELSPKLTLHGNYPNPLSDCANIVFDLPQPSQISVYVTDLLGRTVQMIIYGWYETGRNHTAEICMNDAAPGIYHYLLMADTGDQVVQQSKAMAVVR